MTLNPIFCAVDRPDLDGALALGRAVGGLVGGLKLGLEFFAACGPDGVRALGALGAPVFLDLKLHDIPNTVARVVRALAGLPISHLTVHAAGGAAMLRAAAAVTPRPKLLAVTVLTSLDEEDLAAAGITGTPLDQTARLAALAASCGLDGVVCSPLEIGAVRAVVGSDLLICTPGVRPVGDAAGDQKRTSTPAGALRAGADLLVIGRPITGAADPAAAARALLAELPRAA